MKLYNSIITIIALIAICVMSYLLSTNIIITNINNNYKDSINIVIKNKDSIIDHYKNTIIEHTKVITLIKTKYDTIYSDYGNINIVSDDSITMYISSKIHNAR